MNYHRYCLLLLGLLALIVLGSADYDQSPQTQPQADQPQPPIFPTSFSTVGNLVQGYPSNDTFMVFYDYNAQVF